MHWKILTDAAEGKLGPMEMAKALKERLYANLPTLPPLSREALTIWGEELAEALEREKETFVFHGNLRRGSRIPTVKKPLKHWPTWRRST